MVRYWMVRPCVARAFVDPLGPAGDSRLCHSRSRTWRRELLFRGLMFRGFVHAPRDAALSIVLISLIWSLIHTQYGWFVIAEIFVFGLVLGLVRWSTGSTTLTILLHMLNNLEGWIETGLVLG